RFLFAREQGVVIQPGEVRGKTLGCAPGRATRTTLNPWHRSENRSVRGRIFETGVWHVVNLHPENTRRTSLVDHAPRLRDRGSESGGQHLKRQPAVMKTLKLQAIHSVRLARPDLKLARNLRFLDVPEPVVDRLQTGRPAKIPGAFPCHPSTEAHCVRV